MISETELSEYFLDKIFSSKKIELLNLSTESEDTIVFKNLAKSKKEINGINTYDFVLIHQGIIDKILEKMKKEYNQENLNWLFVDGPLKNIYEPKKKLIIHSGRSQPEFLPTGAIYIPFASIENSFFDCKQTLTELLYSSNESVG